MKTQACVSALIAVIVFSAAWTGLMVHRQRPVLPVAGLLHRSTVDPTVDRGGHSRGIVQVDLMRQIMADRARAVPAAAEQGESVRPGTASRANLIPCSDAQLRRWCWRMLRRRPVICELLPRRGRLSIVFYLGSTCMACMTHLVEMEAAMPRFQARGAGLGRQCRPS